MAEINATILIPDISGFTTFMTTTELSHSSMAINMLIDAIVNAADKQYEVSEIEGDAVLLIRQDPAPTKKEILDNCLSIFHAFHFQRTWMQQHTLCPCKACIALDQLTLKFVVHHGPLAEIRVGKFVKHSGREMIVAHRLLKNSINDNEYLLVTNKMMLQAKDDLVADMMEWNSSSEEITAIGKVDYQFALLHEARKKATLPPAPNFDYPADDTPYYEVTIAANFKDVYMYIMNVPTRNSWVPGLREVAQDIPHAFVGSIHRCSFDNLETVITPRRMNFSGDEIFYAETCEIPEFGIVMTHEFIVKDIDGRSSIFASRFMNAGDKPVPPEINAMLSGNLERMAAALKDHCEQ
jgi:hypothetical protein